MSGYFELPQQASWVDLSEADRAFPSQAVLLRGETLDLLKSSTYFYVVAGEVTLQLAHGTFALRVGMYGVAAGGVINATNGVAFAVGMPSFSAPLLLGGPLEPVGRLRYIDGCTDTLLIAPWRLGDPCLNHLHIPPNTRQSEHIHPSLRVGVIARGSGVCVTPTGEHLLRPGLCFVLAPHQKHYFCTHSQALDVVVFHPDSDTGPTDEDHPMRNRTWQIAREQRV